MSRIETIEQLQALPMNAVFVDRIGLAWQVTALGADSSWHKSGADTRRNGFVQAGNHVVYEAAQMSSVLPARMVNDGTPEPVKRRCPDDGACHHLCEGPCFRVQTCVPLSGVYPDDRWPAEVKAEHSGELRAIL